MTPLQSLQLRVEIAQLLPTSNPLYCSCSQTFFASYGGMLSLKESAGMACRPFALA